MKTKKFRLLKVVAIICFIFAIIQIGIGLTVWFFPVSDNTLIELMNDIQIEDGMDELQIPDEIKTDEEIITKEIVLEILKAIIAIIYFIQAIFSVIEGLLIYRAIKKGKTTLIIIFLLMGFIFPLLTLINAAINSTYDINSAMNVITLLIKTIILKQIFEIRRMNADLD